MRGGAGDWPSFSYVSIAFVSSRAFIHSFYLAHPYMRNSRTLRAVRQKRNHFKFIICRINISKSPVRASIVASNLKNYVYIFFEQIVFFNRDKKITFNGISTRIVIRRIKDFLQISIFSTIPTLKSCDNYLIFFTTSRVRLQVFAARKIFRRFSQPTMAPSKTNTLVAFPKITKIVSRKHFLCPILMKTLEINLVGNFTNKIPNFFTNR